jgi:hypothetical protein
MKDVQRTVKPRLRITWRAARALGSVPAPIYALAYIGVMLTFAVLYDWLVPRGFHHPTAQFEPSLAAEAVSIQREIRASMIRAIAGGSDSGRVWLGEWRVDTSAVTINSLAPDSAGFRFSLRRYAMRQIPRGEALRIVSAPVSVSLVSSSDHFAQFQRKEWLYLPVEAVLLDSELQGVLSDSEYVQSCSPSTLRILSGSARSGCPEAWPAS